MTFALAAALVGACADTDQSAIPPGVADSGASVPDAAGTASPAARPDVALVLDRAPQPRRIYFLRGRDLWQLPIDNLAAPVVTGQDIAAFSPASDGERVVVVSQAPPGSPAGQQIALVKDDSTVELRLNGGSLPGDHQPIVSVAWAPQGQAVAVARADGGVEVVNVDGSAREIVKPGAGQPPGDLSWSPDGKTLAWLQPAGAGHATGLYTAAASGGPARRVVAAADPSSAVLAAAWLPGRGTLAYLRGRAGMAGGDLFEVSADGTGNAVLVSAGQFAPVAGIYDLATSPDGRYLAVTVFVPGESRPHFQSLRLVDLATGATAEIPTNRGEAVTDVWFASGQLIFRAIDETRTTTTGAYTGVEPFALYQVDLTSMAVQERYRG